jgi:hypothetical protein
MPTILSFLSGRQITNDSGVPQTGAKLLHYRETTTTALTVWQDEAGTVQHAQPVVCDAGGFVPLIYVDDTFDWKVVVTTSADVTLKTYDELAKAESATSAVGFAPPLFPWTQVTSGGSPVALTAADAGKAYEADTTSGNIEFDLPSAASVGDGKGFLFKKTAAANSMIIDPSGSETIDDASASLTLVTTMAAVGIFSNGAEWYRPEGPLAGLKAIQVFTASGTYTPRAGLTQALVISTGGGGGGGGADSDGSSTGGAPGGSAGATCIELLNAVAVGASQTITIGAGGTAGANTGTAGGNGGDTTFGGYHTAGGGLGGTGSNPGGATESLPGVAGGTATGGLINIPGGPSGASLGTTVARGGDGGDSFWGGGAKAGIDLSASGAVAGNTATVYGAGASGGANVNTAAGVAGGVGAPGICVVLEFGE